MNYTLRNEAAADIAAIHALTAAAFATAEHSSHTEHFIVDALRARGELAVSLVAEVDGERVGHVAISPVRPRSDFGTARMARAGHRCGVDACRA